MIKRKSQYSMEFLIFFAILSTIFFVWLVIYSNITQEAYTQREKKAINDLGKSIQTHLFTAANSESGYFSENLFIPRKAGPVNYELVMQNGTAEYNGSYVFVIRTEKQDHTFHIPYTLGKLQKGENKLYSVCGVVSATKAPPLKDEDCNVQLSKCANFKDDDGDMLIDEEDGGCWKSYDNPVYDPSRNNESAGEPAQGSEYVYNYYVLCKTADSKDDGLCDSIPTMNNWLTDAGLESISEQLCEDKTSEKFCD